MARPLLDSNPQNQNQTRTKNHSNQSSFSSNLSSTSSSSITSIGYSSLFNSGIKNLESSTLNSESSHNNKKGSTTKWILNKTSLRSLSSSHTRSFKPIQLPTYSASLPSSPSKSITSLSATTDGTTSIHSRSRLSSNFGKSTSETSSQASSTSATFSHLGTKAAKILGVNNESVDSNWKNEVKITIEESEEEEFGDRKLYGYGYSYAIPARKESGVRKVDNELVRSRSGPMSSTSRSNQLSSNANVSNTSASNIPSTSTHIQPNPSSFKPMYSSASHSSFLNFDSSRANYYDKQSEYNSRQLPPPSLLSNSNDSESEENFHLETNSNLQLSKNKSIRSSNRKLQVTTPINYKSHFSDTTLSNSTIRDRSTPSTLSSPIPTNSSTRNNFSSRSSPVNKSRINSFSTTTTTRSLPYKLPPLVKSQPIILSDPLPASTTTPESTPPVLSISTSTLPLIEKEENKLEEIKSTPVVSGLSRNGTSKSGISTSSSTTKKKWRNVTLDTLEGRIVKFGERDYNEAIIARNLEFDNERKGKIEVVKEEEEDEQKRGKKVGSSEISFLDYSDDEEKVDHSFTLPTKEEEEDSPVDKSFTFPPPISKLSSTSTKILLAPKVNQIVTKPNVYENRIDDRMYSSIRTSFEDSGNSSRSSYDSGNHPFSAKLSNHTSSSNHRTKLSLGEFPSPPMIGGGDTKLMNIKRSDGIKL